MRIKLNIFILSAVIYFALPSVSDAAWEYITHGGYDAAVNAWKRTALIFSDNGYKGLFISAIVLGAITIFASTYIRIATGAKAGGLSWATPVLAGMAIYAAFIAPKDKLIIYDELLNRGPEEVDGIPLILATSAGMLNKIEKGFIDIVSTSSDPASDYRLNAGGTGWALLDTVSVTSLLSPNEFSTISRFVLDCVYFELNREGTNLDLNKIASGEQKYDTIIMESANPVLYTVVYTDNSVGTTTTCYNAAQQVASIINTAKINQESLKTICSSRGFNSSGASLNACSNLMESTLQYTLPNISSGTGLALYNAQRIMAETFLDALNSKSPSVSISKLATSQTQSQFIGLGVHANSWLPVLKESLTAVAISISPLLLLFAATPIAGRALSLVFGMFVWLTLWGIIDAVVHGFGMDLAKQASQMIRANSLDIGFKAMYMWPDYTARVAATFGALRWSGLMLASVISGMLIKFGGTALAMLAGSISGMPQSSGAAYGSSIMRSAGGVLNSEVLPTNSWHNGAVQSRGVENLVRGLAQKGGGEMAGGASFGNRLGTGTIARGVEGQLLSGAHGGGGALEAINHFGFKNAVIASAYHHMRTMTHGYNLESMETASMVGRAAAQLEIGGVQGKQIVADSLGLKNLKEFGEFESRGRILNQEMANRLNQRYQTDAFRAGMRLDYGTDGQGHFFMRATSSDPLSRDNIDISGSGIRIEKTASDLMVGGTKFTGSMSTVRSWDGKEFTSLQGNFTDRNGVTRYGHAYLDTNGNLVFFDSKSGVNMQDSMRHSQMLTLSGEQLRPVIEQLRAAGPRFKNTADGIEKAMKEGRAVAFSIERDPTTGQIATIHAGTGGTFRQEDFRSNQTGWENITKAVSKGEFGSHNTYYHGSEDHHYGKRVNIGSELPYIVTTGDWKPLQEKYSDMWYNSMMGKQVAIKAADSVGIFGKFEQMTRDSAAVGYQLRTGGALAKFLSAGGIDIQAYLKGERSAVEQVNANTLALGISKRYEQIQADRNLTTEQKSKLFAQELHSLYKELDFYGGASTAQQLATGANNPYKGQRIPPSKNYDPTTAGDVHGAVEPFR